MPYFQNTLTDNKTPFEELEELIRLENFLTSSDLNNAELINIPGDCSRRNYFRAQTAKHSFIIMDLLNEPNVLQSFIDIANILSHLGLSAPKIYNISDDKSLVLLEDFGNNSYTNLLKANISMENELYYLATDALKILYTSNVTYDLKHHSNQVLTKELDIFIQWYLKPKLANKNVSQITAEFFSILAKLYAHLDTHNPIISLKDFHADNLFYLPERSGVKKVGIIDFQDALFSTPAYDLVSLLEDARRDVSPNVVVSSLENFTLLFDNKADKDNYKEMYAINSIQRNLRIIGLFHRLNLRDKKPHYSLLFLPRVVRYVKAALELPSLGELKNWFTKYDVL